MKFTKMHGLGNDYICINCFDQNVQNPAKLAKFTSNRHFGIGADGLILIEPSAIASVKMQIFNADGSEAEICGNGIRCVAKYAYEHNLAKTQAPFAIPGQPPWPVSLTIETQKGVLKVGLKINEGNTIQKVCVNMGQPILAPAKIPVKLPGEKIIGVPIKINGHKLSMTCISMGNPHAIFFCNNINDMNLAQMGPIIETHQLFPQRTNVHFVKSDNPKEFTMRTWERGSGITLACGSGACACCVAAVLTGKNGRSCIAHLPGGDLDLNWSQEDNCVYMAGPATEVFEGSLRPPK